MGRGLDLRPQRRAYGNMMGYQTSGRGYRILIIWLPERMQEALGNKLLKLVEEAARAHYYPHGRDGRAVRPSDACAGRMQTLRLRPLTGRDRDGTAGDPDGLCRGRCPLRRPPLGGQLPQGTRSLRGRAAELGGEYAPSAASSARRSMRSPAR